MSGLCLIMVAGFVMLPSSYGQKTDKSRSKIIITGTVTGLDGKPAPNTIIYIDSIDTGVTTNDFGIYRVKVDSGAKTI